MATENGIVQSTTPARTARVLPWALLSIAALGLALAFAIHYTTLWTGLYGYTIFVGIPLIVGILSGIMRTLPLWRAVVASRVVAIALLVHTALFLMIIGSEGLICTLMAAPIALPAAAAGAVIGVALNYYVLVPRMRGVARISLLLLLPAMFGFESALDAEPPLYAVTTSIDVAAPPEQVWKHVVSFPPLPKPKDLAFRAGIAYPVHATIEGEGVGAVRHCIFSTGAFVEPIEIWEPPRLLRFAVTESPPPLRELSFREPVEPPHLDGFLEARRGQFHLVQTEDGMTRIEGTTWYSHGLWPAWYWRNWSDYLIHNIHTRVLEHIKRLSESNVAP